MKNSYKSVIALGLVAVAVVCVLAATNLKREQEYTAADLYEVACEKIDDAGVHTVSGTIEVDALVYIDEIKNYGNKSRAYTEINGEYSRNMAKASIDVGLYRYSYRNNIPMEVIWAGDKEYIGCEDVWQENEDSAMVKMADLKDLAELGTVEKIVVPGTEYYVLSVGNDGPSEVEGETLEEVGQDGEEEEADVREVEQDGKETEAGEETEKAGKSVKDFIRMVLGIQSRAVNNEILNTLSERLDDTKWRFAVVLTRTYADKNVEWSVRRIQFNMDKFECTGEHGRYFTEANFELELDYDRAKDGMSVDVPEVNGTVDKYMGLFWFDKFNWAHPNKATSVVEGDTTEMSKSEYDPWGTGVYVSSEVDTLKIEQPQLIEGSKHEDESGIAWSSGVGTENKADTTDKKPVETAKEDEETTVMYTDLRKYSLEVVSSNRMAEISNDFLNMGKTSRAGMYETEDGKRVDLKGTVKFDKSFGLDGWEFVENSGYAIAQIQNDKYPGVKIELYNGLPDFDGDSIDDIKSKGFNGYKLLLRNVSTENFPVLMYGGFKITQAGEELGLYVNDAAIWLGDPREPGAGTWSIRYNEGNQQVMMFFDKTTGKLEEVDVVTER